MNSLNIQTSAGSTFVIRSYWEMLEKYPGKKKIKAYGQLVLLGFDVTTFTPVAYQRHSL